MDQAYRFAVAPMMDWTTRHCRWFHRVLTRRSLLYTEMVTSGAILYGDQERLLGFDAFEHPIALQLGGSDPGEMARAAAIGRQFGYDEININVGCPSDRVRNGRFGACLMAEPDTVAACVTAMRQAVDIPVTIKTRIGIDDLDDQEYLYHFVDRVASAGCERFIIHARKAWLQGLSPKENREVPPLHYDRVHALKKAFPELTIVINGGLNSLEALDHQLSKVDGVMLGRSAYQSCYLLASVDRIVFKDPRPDITRLEAVRAMIPYCNRETARGVPLHAITRHMLGLFHGCAGGKRWRRVLSEEARTHRGDAADLFDKAMAGLARDEAA